MKRLLTYLTLFALIALFATSCARGISPYDAANGKAKCGRYLR